MKPVLIEHPLRATVLVACRHLLRPIASLLIRCGISWRDFAEASKGAFVDAATHEYGLQGRPTNATRVAILTGLNRKEVSRIRGAEGTVELAGDVATSNVSRILGAWHQESEFLDAQGTPLVLPLQGEGASVEELIRRHGGDLTSRALLKELLRVQAIERVDENHVRALKRYFLPDQLDALSIDRAATVIHDLAATLNHNLTANLDNTGANFEGRASNRHIPSRSLPALREFVEAQGEPLLYRIDDWLSEHEVAPTQRESTKLIRAGAGIYLFADSADGVKK